MAEVTPPTLGHVTRREWHWVTIAAVIVMALTALPYLLGGLSSTADYRFSGFLLNVEDGNTYLAKMQQGAHGAWLFRLSYTYESHSPAFLFPFYLELGRLVGLLVGVGEPLRLHTGLVVAYHLARVVIGVGLLVAGYRFLAEFSAEIWLRRSGWVLLALGGGLGWLQLPFVANRAWPPPVEFYSPEAFTFLMAYILPHLLWARLGWVLGLLAYLRGLTQGGWRWPVLAAGLWLLSALGQPAYLPMFFALVAIHVVVLMVLTLWQGDAPSPECDAGTMALRAMWIAPIVILPALPLVAYSGLLFYVEPVYALWREQSPHYPSPPFDYLVAYGLLLIPALVGLRQVWQKNIALATLAGVWLVMIPVFLYLPSPFQRRLIEGFQWLLVGLAIAGLPKLHWPKVWVGALLGLSLPGAILILVFGGLTATQPRLAPAETPSAAFTSTYRVAAYEFIGRNLQVGDVVLSSYAFGNGLPAYAPVVAIYGHNPETVRIESIRQQAGELFYWPTATPAERARTYQIFGYPYFVIGPDEVAEFNGAFDPNGAIWPVPIGIYYAYNDVSIWSLQLDPSD